MGQDVNSYPIGGTDGLGREDPARRALSAQTPIVQQQEAIAELGGVVEVVQDREHGEPATGQPGQEGHQLDLQPQIGPGSRLVEQEDPWLLGEGLCEANPLPLTARQATHEPMAPRGHAHGFHGAGDGRSIALRLPAPRRLVRVSAEHDELLDRETSIIGGQLRQMGQSAGQLARLVG